MSGPALKWAMEPNDEQTARPAMSAEKRLLLIALAYEANKFDNTIDKTIPSIAKRYGIGRQSALRYASEFMADGPLRDTGKRTGYHNRVAVLQFVTEWSPGAASRTRTKARSNSTSVDTIQKDQGAEKAARIVRAVALNSTSVHLRIVRANALNGTSVDTIQPPSIYGLQELPSKSQEKHNAQSARACPVSQAKPGPHDDAGSVTGCTAQKPVPTEATARPTTGPEADRTGGIAVIAKAMVNEFYAHCEANVRSEVENGCLRFAGQGLDVDVMRAAITTAKRQEKKLGRKPRWASVRNVLDGVLNTRESTIGFLQVTRFQQETIVAARGLEEIYAQHLDKPAWTATRSRYDFAEWLCQCVASSNVDGGMFAAACRDAKTSANGRPPTWKHVRNALDARIKVRESGAQQTAAGDKPFFDQPGATPGTFIAQGNSTLH
jgi:hypothetical protein